MSELVPVRGGPLRVRERLMLPTAAIAFTLIAWARLPGDARRAVWAEDGAVFLSQLGNGTFLSTLFKPYAGYLQFWPRVLTEVATRSGGLRSYSDRIALVSCIAVALLGVGVLVWSGSVFDRAVTRILVASSTVLVPIAPLEALGNVANLHWFVLWAAGWLIIYRPATRWGAACLAVLGATFAATEIQVALLFPLLLVGARSRRTWAIRAGVAAGLVAQGVVTLASPRGQSDDHLGAMSTAVGFLVNGPLATVVGDQGSGGRLLSQFGWTVAVGALLPYLGAVLYVLIRGSRTERTLAGAMAGISVLTWGAAVWVNLTGPNQIPFASFTSQQFISTTYLRYGVVPDLCLLALPVIALSTCLRRRDASVSSSGRRLERQIIDRVVLALPVVLLVAQLAWFTPNITVRSNLPPWAGSVDGARSACAAAGAHTALIAQAPLSWFTELPCTAVR